MAADGIIEREFRKKFPGSAALYEKAQKCFPSGVTHDGRFLKPFPIYIRRAEGSRKWDVDGNEIIDYWVGHGSLILGHRHPEVIAAVGRQLGCGTHFGACHELEIAWAKAVMRLMPSVEKIRFVNSGTEATLMGMRLARAFTGKPKLLKFQGHFHGWNDHAMHGVFPDFGKVLPCGVLPGVSENMVVIPANNPELLEETLKRDPDIGQVIIEPTGGGFTDVPVRPAFHKPLRDITRRLGVVLIYDEVITGFRVSPGGAQALYGVKPDLTCMAKILAGGFPGGALGGREDIMRLLAYGSDPEWNASRKMYHPGTYNANPVSAAAGVKTLELVSDGSACARADATGKALRDGLNAIIDNRGLPWAAYGLSSGYSMAMGGGGWSGRAADFPQFDISPEQLKSKNSAVIHKFRCAMLLGGVDTPGKHSWISAAHSEQDVAQTLAAFDRALDLMKSDGVL
ncbi:MAG TPA: aminotransferase class III-fold pyridoxal phosphate-dependent enzyme [Candidatus Brocadiia bacterium]|nr:aminotransferase class III-fold pyridoxal phosphate-dependent enzyme [Candidatus Brocadiia bacterium]